MRSIYSLLAALALVGCATPAPVVIRPPAALLAPCVVPPRKLVVNADLVLRLQDYRAALDSCNDDKAALRGYKVSE